MSSSEETAQAIVREGSPGEGSLGFNGTVLEFCVAVQIMSC